MNSVSIFESPKIIFPKQSNTGDQNQKNKTKKKKEGILKQKSKSVLSVKITESQDNRRELRERERIPVIKRGISNAVS